MIGRQICLAKRQQLSRVFWKPRDFSRKFETRMIGGQAEQNQSHWETYFELLPHHGVSRKHVVKT